MPWLAEGQCNDVIHRVASLSDGDPGEAAHFLRDAITELSQIAHRHGLETLAYLLHMAQMEADEWCGCAADPTDQAADAIDFAASPAVAPAFGG
jgi:hypothetical protein